MRISDWCSDVCSSDLPIHDVVRRAEAVVHQLPVALRADDKQRRQLALRDARRKLDIDLLAVIERAQRLPRRIAAADRVRSEEHTSELQSLMRISYAVFCLKKKQIHRTPRESHYIT